MKLSSYLDDVFRCWLVSFLLPCSIILMCYEAKSSAMTLSRIFISFQLMNSFFAESVSKYLTCAEDEKSAIEEKLTQELPVLKNMVQEIKKYK